MQLFNKCGNGNSQTVAFKLYMNFLFSPIPVSVVTHCCCSISTKGLGPSLWHPICRDIDCAWVWPFNLAYLCAAYPKSSLRNWTDSVSFCIYISERCLLIVAWQHQVQMERRVARSEKYAGEEDSSTTYQPEKHLGSLALSVHVQAIIVTSSFFSSRKKNPTHATELSSLGKDFPPSSFEWFDKGLSYVPSLSIMSTMPYGVICKELYGDRWGALHHACPWLNRCLLWETGWQLEALQTAYL